MPGGSGVVPGRQTEGRACAAGDRVQVVSAAPGVRAGHNRPSGSVPLLDERVVVTGRVGICPGRHAERRARARDSIQVVPVAPRVLLRAGHNRPSGSVPLLNEGVCVARSVRR